MKLYLSIPSVSRLRERISAILDCLDSFEICRPIDYWLTKYGARRPICQDVLQAAQREDMGYLEIDTAIGHFRVSWRYHPKAWFQRVSGEISANKSQLDMIVQLARELSKIVDAFYAQMDLSDILEIDVDENSRSKRPAPIECLYDLYWFNYFGPQLTHVLRNDHSVYFEVPSVLQREHNNGWEVCVAGAPTARPYPEVLEEYLRRTRIFQKYYRKARFCRGRINIDYSQVRTKVETLPSA
jgi:hypothetical protein